VDDQLLDRAALAGVGDERDEKFRAMAEKHVRSFGLRIAGRNDTNTHDLGFLYTLSCVAAWRLTGNREARGFSLLAAEALLERFHEKRKLSRRGAIWPIRNRPGG
jgi:hypothetical protein